MRRRRPLAVLWPFLGLDHLVRWLRRIARSHSAPTAAAGVALAGLTVLAVIAVVGEAPPRPTLFVQGDSSIPLSGDQLMDAYAGMTVDARGARIQSVVGPTGFWVGSSRRDRVWVDVHDQEISSQQITSGRRISFQGTLTPNTPETLERAGRGGPSDRAQLEREGYHIDMLAGTVRPG